MSDSPFADFTEEEFDEYFATPIPEHRFRRFRITGWMKLLGLIVAVGLMAGSVTVIVDQFRNFRSLNEAGEIRDRALERIEVSQWGWLATDVRIDSIPEPEIGGRVVNNPPDGVVMVDLRAWDPEQLDALVDHELGHLLDFAVSSNEQVSLRRGGLESEAWAECAAVAAETRRVDTSTVDTEYHCYDEELTAYVVVVGDLTEVCAEWVGECREFG